MHSIATIARTPTTLHFTTFVMAVHKRADNQMDGSIY